MKWACKDQSLWMNTPSSWSRTEVTLPCLLLVAVVTLDAFALNRGSTPTACVPRAGQNVRPLNKREYILDIATEAEPVDSNYSLWFRRVIWSLALKLDNELYVTMHYNQVKRCTTMHLQNHGQNIYYHPVAPKLPLAATFFLLC